MKETCETAGDHAGVQAGRQDGFKGWQVSVWQLYLLAVAVAVLKSFFAGIQLVMHQYISIKLQSVLPV